MQEDIEHRTMTLIINTSKLTGRELAKAMEKVLRYAKTKSQTAARPHGKMSVKKLAAQNQGMMSMEVTDGNIGSFNRVARKYGIDFAPFKVKGEDRYLVFFKAPDKEAMTAAFTEYTQHEVKKASRPSVLARMEQLQAHIKHAVVDRVKKKEIER